VVTHRPIRRLRATGTMQCRASTALSQYPRGLKQVAPCASPGGQPELRPAPAWPRLQPRLEALRILGRPGGLRHVASHTPKASCLRSADWLRTRSQGWRHGCRVRHHHCCWRDSMATGRLAASVSASHLQSRRPGGRRPRSPAAAASLGVRPGLQHRPPRTCVVRRPCPHGWHRAGITAYAAATQPRSRGASPPGPTHAPTLGDAVDILMLTTVVLW
jgi:hypothetical protein